MTKAFDLVNHNILLNKLWAYGLCGLALKWFKSYLTNRKQFVEIAHRYEHSNEIKNYLSSEQYINCGAPQGSILGPILFLLHINNLEHSVKYVKPTFFADDTSIFIYGNNISVVQANVDTTVNQLLWWFEKK